MRCSGRHSQTRAFVLAAALTDEWSVSGAIELVDAVGLRDAAVGHLTQVRERQVHRAVLLGDDAAPELVSDRSDRIRGGWPLRSFS